MLQALDAMLVSGGDDRITLNVDGLNRYGYGPRPRTGDYSYGSSTASTISLHGWQAATQCYDRVDTALKTHTAERVYTDAMTELRQRLLNLCRLDQADAIFAASGTDVHLYAAMLSGLAAGKSTLSISVEASETGSGVAKAMAGKHFSAMTSGGDAVAAGAAVDTKVDLDHICVTARDVTGNPRSSNDIANEIDAIIKKAIAAGRHVLLVVTDVSKTGLISPGLGDVLRLSRTWPQYVTVMIDACQFRLAPETVRAYMGHGFLVALTGSKFFGGPAFSGVLLCPAAISEIWRTLAVPLSLCAYARRAEWPQHWSAAQIMRRTANFGLLLRWTAALAEMERFLVTPPAEIRRVMLALSDAVQSHFKGSDKLELIAPPPLDRTAIGCSGGWDEIASIFPFMVRTTHGGYLTAAETQALYQHAARNRYRFGQPVPSSQRHGQPVSALRLCISARLIVEGAQGAQSLQKIIDGATAMLDYSAAYSHDSQMMQVA